MENVLPLLGMLAMVALILAAAHYTTKWIALHGTPGLTAARGDERVRVLRVVSLGKDGQAALLQAGNRCLLLGVTPGSVTLLRELDESEAAQWIGGEPAGTAVPPSFLEALQRSFSKKK